MILHTLFRLLTICCSGHGWRRLVGGLVSALVLAACSILPATPNQLAVLATTPTHPRTAASTTPQTPLTTHLDPTSLVLETQTPLQTQTPPPNLEPFVTAPALRFDSWSPKSQWIAYWTGEAHEETPASLAFFNVLTSETCSPAGVLADDLTSGRVLCQQENRVIVVLNDEGLAMKGAPCELFKPTENVIHPDTSITFSLDGHYRAEKTYSPEGQLVAYTVTITDITTGQPVVTFSWEASIYLSASEPGWLNHELYLIGQTYQDGIVYLSLPDGQSHDLFTDLMGLTSFDNETVWLVFYTTNPITGVYHILLQWQGAPTYENWSPLLLYHSELAQVEELSFYGVRSFGGYGSWGLSPDGQWLIVGNPVEDGDPANDTGEDYWLRAVDPPGSEAVQFSGRGGLGELSSNGQMMAFVRAASVIDILSFPDGQFLSQWHTVGYHLDRMWWSHDGTHLVVQGFPDASDQEALFLIQP